MLHGLVCRILHMEMGSCMIAESLLQGQRVDVIAALCWKHYDQNEQHVHEREAGLELEV